MSIRSYIPFRNFELVTGALTLLVVFLVSFFSRQLRLADHDAISSESATEVILTEKTQLDDLAGLLIESGVIEEESELMWAGRLLGWRNFKKGRYLIDGSYSYDVFLSKLAKGIQDPKEVVILPGIDVERFANRLGDELELSSIEVLELFEDSTYLASKNLSSEQLFGRMLPETYLMYWTITPKEAVNRILSEFDAKVTEPFNYTIEESKYSIDDMVAMASIVEWEAELSEEKEIISGLYWNRINKRMRLQADPTVNYAVGERRRLLFEDYEVDHPFNTYKYYGLPPAAITNPSLSSIRAAIEPQDHEYIYMVANPEGGHVFTRTFREHQIESEKWRKWLRQQYRIKRAREAEEANSLPLP